MTRAELIRPEPSQFRYHVTELPSYAVQLGSPTAPLVAPPSPDAQALPRGDTLIAPSMVPKNPTLEHYEPRYALLPLELS